MARPRQFDEAEVLDRAMQVFCAHGYDGASMMALASAMGLAGPSVYAAFGSKRGLFEAVLDRHIACEGEQRDRILSAPTARAVAERWLFEAADRLPGVTPAGSVLILGGLSASPDNGDVPAALARRRQANELALWDRLERAKADGDLPADADPAALAAFVTVVCDGMVVRAAAGATTADLRKIAVQAMRAWPSA
ncbi:TetR/AcrR family transcriptional regulator [Sphingomonas sp.]|uniref:TetR/AcrR family transcriptional regulator n=1 Tax=Sphingomonas sp. TaxID=28214 RepID=UPI003AFFEFA3